MFGAIIPAPLAIPAIVTTVPSSSVICFEKSLWCVSVVMIPLAAATSDFSSFLSFLEIFLIPASITSIGRKWPMIPVLITSAPSSAAPTAWAAQAAAVPRE